MWIGVMHDITWIKLMVQSSYENNFLWEKQSFSMKQFHEWLKVIDVQIEYGFITIETPTTSETYYPSHTRPICFDPFVVFGGELN